MAAKKKSQSAGKKVFFWIFATGGLSLLVVGIGTFDSFVLARSLAFLLGSTIVPGLIGGVVISLNKGNIVKKTDANFEKQLVSKKDKLDKMYIKYKENTPLPSIKSNPVDNNQTVVIQTSKESLNVNQTRKGQ